MPDQFTKMVKAGKITYFFDVKEAKNKSKYLSITASQPSTSGDKKFTKRSIFVFNEAAEDFHSAVGEAVAKLK
ncbi:MAG: DUF3276 family protein [Ignavibacteria bacterium]|nr:DUF3276 family protein [Ignavibacteria bacterium]